METPSAWLARVQHDLVKRLLWPARDRRDLGGPVRPGELSVALTDDEGAPIGAVALWTRLRAEAPAGASPPSAVLDAFGRAVAVAVAAAEADDLAGILDLETAFGTLSGAVARGGSGR